METRKLREAVDHLHNVEQQLAQLADLLESASPDEIVGSQLSSYEAALDYDAIRGVAQDVIADLKRSLQAADMALLHQIAILARQPSTAQRYPGIALVECGTIDEYFQMQRRINERKANFRRTWSTERVIVPWIVYAQTLVPNQS